MAKKEFKDNEGPSKLSKVNKTQEEWHTNTSDDEESFVNEIDTFEDEEYFNEVKEFDEVNDVEDFDDLEDVDDVTDVAYSNERERLEKD